MLYELYGVRPWEVDLLTGGEIELADRVARERAKNGGS